MTERRTWEQARAWRAAGVRDAETARRLGVQQSTVLRRLGPAQVQAGGAEDAAADPGPTAAASRRTSRRGRNRRPCRGRGAEAGAASAGAAAGAGGVPPGRRAGGTGGGQRGARPGMRGRCCCTRSSRGPGGHRAAGGRDARRAEVALLTAVSMCFALGAATTEAVQAPGRRPRPGRWPGWERCRRCGRCARAWPRSPTRADPLRLQAMFAAGDAGRGPGDLRGVLRR